MPISTILSVKRRASSCENPPFASVLSLIAGPNLSRNRPRRLASVSASAPDFTLSVRTPRAISASAFRTASSFGRSPMGPSSATASRFAPPKICANGAFLILASRLRTAISRAVRAAPMPWKSAVSPRPESSSSVSFPWTRGAASWSLAAILGPVSSVKCNSGAAASPQPSSPSSFVRRTATRSTAEAPPQRFLACWATFTAVSQTFIS